MKTNKTHNLLIATLTLTLTAISSCSSGGGEDTPTPPPPPVIEAPGKSALTAPANNAAQVAVLGCLHHLLKSRRIRL